VSICVYLWALFLPAKVRGRIEQQVAEQTEGLVNSPLFSRFPPVCSFLLAANSPCMDTLDNVALTMDVWYHLGVGVICWSDQYSHQNSQNHALQPRTQKHLGSVVTHSFVPAERNRSVTDVPLSATRF
jgi:hypothetical protein